MAKRKYTTCAQVEVMLHDYIRTMRIANQDQFPCEQSLAERLGVSRRTLHKGILELERQRTLIPDGRYRRYVQEYRNLERAGKILFLSSGRHHTFLFQAMERLWNLIHPLLQRHHADVGLLLTNPEVEVKSILKQLDQADVILYAGCLSADQETVMQAIYRHQNNKPVISLLETQAQSIRNMISLDNYATGRMAAEYLIDAGCRKIIGLWEVCHNQDFSRRAQGFADSLSTRNLGGIESIIWSPPKSGKQNLRETVDWAMLNGFDGLFLMSDECIGDILSEYIASNRIPDRTRIITTDGTQECLRLTPPIPCINHATDKIAEEILENITLIARKAFKNVRMTVHPSFYC